MVVFQSADAGPVFGQTLQQENQVKNQGYIRNESRPWKTGSQRTRWSADIISIAWFAFNKKYLALCRRKKNLVKKKNMVKMFETIKWQLHRFLFGIDRMACIFSSGYEQSNALQNQVLNHLEGYDYVIRDSISADKTMVSIITGVAVIDARTSSSEELSVFFNFKPRWTRYLLDSSEIARKVDPVYVVAIVPEAALLVLWYFLPLHQ
jgi:hypothetical protein